MNIIITDTFKKVFIGRCKSKKKRHRKKYNWRVEDLPVMKLPNGNIICNRKQAALINIEMRDYMIRNPMNGYGYRY